MRNTNRWKSRARLIVIPAALALIGFGPIAGADTYFVRTNGDDARSGTSALDAFATPGKAATIAVAGDLIYIGGGTYSSQIIPTTSGSAGLPIAYIADTSGKQTGDSGVVVIKHSGAPVVSLDAIGYTSFDGFTFLGGNATIEITNNSNNITITNCVMDQSVGYGVHISGSSSCDISGSTVSGSVKDAIRMDSSGAVTIRDCTIDVPTSFGVYGIVLGDITIANCKFVRTASSGHGIWVTPNNRSTPTSVTITGNDMSLRGGDVPEHRNGEGVVQIGLLLDSAVPIYLRDHRLRVGVPHG